MSQIELLKEKLSELVADPWADKAEVDAAASALKEAELLLTQIGEVTRADYEAIAEIGKGLGIDGVQAARLFSQIELECKEQANTKAGMFAFRCLCENYYMRRRINEMQLHASGSVFALEQLDKPPTPPLQPKNGKK